MNEQQSTFHDVTLNHDDENSAIPNAPGSSTSPGGENPPTPETAQALVNNNENAEKPNEGEVNTVSNAVAIVSLVEPQDERSLIRLAGPAIRDYLLEFLEYLRVRTGFRPSHFRAPERFQNTMTQMEQTGLPIRIWRTLMNSSIRLIAMGGLALNAENVVDVIMTVVSVVADFYMNNMLMKGFVWILKFVGSEYLTAIIIGIYHFFAFSAKIVWAYIAKKLRQYGIFVARQMQANSQIMNS